MCEARECEFVFHVGNYLLIYLLFSFRFSHRTQGSVCWSTDCETVMRTRQNLALRTVPWYLSCGIFTFLCQNNKPFQTSFQATLILWTKAVYTYLCTVECPWEPLQKYLPVVKGLFMFCENNPYMWYAYPFLFPLYIQLVKNVPALWNHKDHHYIFRTWPLDLI
jgi:hypothetical protein